MVDKQLPARPNLAQYKKQAKELAHHCALSDADALAFNEGKRQGCSFH